jgi:hypothetical protein
MLDYLLARMAERSTWSGVLGLLGAFGVYSATPEQAQAITAFALAIFSGFSTVAPDRLRDSSRNVRSDSNDAPPQRPAVNPHPDER